MSTPLLSPAGAYTVASSWGSYINASDPGRVFYTFPPGDARPEDEEHRAELLAYTAELIERECGRPLPLTDEQLADIGALTALRAFFTETELRP